MTFDLEQWVPGENVDTDSMAREELRAYRESHLGGVSGEVVTHKRGEELPNVSPGENLLMYGEVWNKRGENDWHRVLCAPDSDSVDIMDNDEMQEQEFTYNMI